MNKARLEWVISGLDRYALTASEDLFLKTASAAFDQSQALTERQEERLENLYKEKSRLAPNKKSDHFSFKKGDPEKTKPRRSYKKAFF